MNNKGLDIDITKGHYNKTICEDGIHHIVDTSKEYTYYDMCAFKRYFDIDNKQELIEKMKADFENAIERLDKMLEKEELENDR